MKENIKISKRKKVQYINYENFKGFPNYIEVKPRIKAIFKDGEDKEHEEYFEDDKTVEEIKDIYINFNKTLKPGESKRDLVALFHAKPIEKLTKIDL